VAVEKKVARHYVHAKPGAAGRDGSGDDLALDDLLDMSRIVVRWFMAVC